MKISALRLLIGICFLVCIAQDCDAQRAFKMNNVVCKMLFTETDNNQLELRELFKGTAALEAENPRLVAICLNITLGLFGVHRMYLGTDLVVPIAYTFTIGGGCVLWFVDLIVLITAKDIKPYMNNNNMFMWAKQ